MKAEVPSMLFWCSHISLAARCQQVTCGFQPAGAAASPIRSNLDQLPFLHEVTDHGHDCRGLGVHGAADLCEAQTVLFAFQQADKLCEHGLNQTPAAARSDK